MSKCDCLLCPTQILIVQSVVDILNTYTQTYIYIYTYKKIYIKRKKGEKMKNKKKKSLMFAECLKN